MNWSRKHLKKIRKEIAEWYKENNEEQLSELVSIATNQYHSLKEE